MTTSADLHERIVGQNLPKRFLTNVERNGSIEVLNWKNSAGDWESKTLTEMAEDTARLTAALKDLGVGAGDTVVMMIRNRQEFHALDMAVLFCGATPVSIYNSSAPDQIQYLINDCSAKVAILEDADFLARFDAVRDKIPTIKHTALIEAEGAADSIIRYSDMLAFEPVDLAAEAETAALSDTATIIYTSGTTGPPKGVMLSHSNVAWTLESVGQSMRDQTDIADFAGKRHVSYLPMAHVMERLLGHYYMVDFATKVYCCPETAQMPATVRETKPNVFIGVPRVWEKIYAGVNAAMAADPEKEQQFNAGIAAALPIMEKMTAGTATEEEIATWNFLDEVGFRAIRGLVGLDEVEIGISGAAPIPAEILGWFRAIGVPLSEGYGMSETTAVLSWSAAAKPGYVGRPATGVEMKIAEDGEVLARGGNMFEGYLGLPEKTAESIDDEGWVHTGDIGVIDDEGYLKIVDRKKELIITAGGKNISPANLEAALKMIPLVGQACAVGEQKPFVTALLVLDPDAAAAWATEHGLEGDAATMGAMAQNPDVIAEVEAGLIEAMSSFNNAEAVKKVKVLGAEWLPDTDLLTPTSKLKRRGILSTFAAEIDALYQK
ncbi:MAG: long-chain acyl-CoA synthetase [Ilumatobacter sp.]|jgi:long-chain acyl-CoA synthetase